MNSVAGWCTVFDVGLKGLLMQRAWLMLSGLMMLRAGKQKGLAGLNETKKKSQTSRLYEQ